MSTNKTTNYQINQWETEDRVLLGQGGHSHDGFAGGPPDRCRGETFLHKIVGLYL